MTTKVISLVSVGAHPSSGRARRAEQDARAVELGLQLAGDNLQVVHAGDPHEEALRAYLGMGLEHLDVLEQPAGADVLGVLGEYLRDAGAQLVLTGSQAETGEGSGHAAVFARREAWLAAGGGPGRGGVDRKRHRPGAAGPATRPAAPPEGTPAVAGDCG